MGIFNVKKIALLCWYNEKIFRKIFKNHFQFCFVCSNYRNRNIPHHATDMYLDIATVANVNWFRYSWSVVTKNIDAFFNASFFCGIQATMKLIFPFYVFDCWFAIYSQWNAKHVFQKCLSFWVFDFLTCKNEQDQKLW